MARLYARASNSSVTLSLKDLEVLGKLITSEIEGYEKQIAALNSAFDAKVKEFAAFRAGGTIAWGGSTEASSQASAASTQNNPAGPQSSEGGVRGDGDTPT